MTMTKDQRRKLQYALYDLHAALVWAISPSVHDADDDALVRSVERAAREAAKRAGFERPPSSRIPSMLRDS